MELRNKISLQREFFEGESFLSNKDIFSLIKDLENINFKFDLENSKKRLGKDGKMSFLTIPFNNSPDPGYFPIGYFLKGKETKNYFLDLDIKTKDHNFIETEIILNIPKNPKYKNNLFIEYELIEERLLNFLKAKK